jgi:error-prone DNA polymerase
MAGVIEFASACEENSLSPILGVNLSFLHKRYRILLLAQSGKLSSLYKFLTGVNFDNEEKLITYPLLERYGQLLSDITVIHTPHSQLAAAVGSRRESEAISIYNSLRTYAPHQYIEIVSHLTNGDAAYSTTFAARNLLFAEKNKIPYLLTNAVRMAKPSDAPILDVLDATRLLKPLSATSVERKNSEGYLKNSKEMRFVADEITRSAGSGTGIRLYESPNKLVESSTLSIRAEIGLGGMHLPGPTMLGHTSGQQMIRELHQRVEVGLNRYSGSIASIAEERLGAELGLIRELGYESYFLTVARVVEIAQSRGIRTSARGSGAGSLVNYLLGISQVEPITNNLLMERFCSPLRSELPDIDIDVESHRRLELYDAIFSAFGDNNWQYPGNRSYCATVSMVERYRARHAIRDVGKALGMDPGEIDYLAKSLPHIRAKNITQALENLPELKSINLKSPLIKVAISLAQRLDHLPRHLAMHPCAISFADLSFHNYAAMEPNPSGYPMLHIDKDGVEAVGILKLDVLGVRMQSAISYCLSEVKRVDGIDIDIDSVPLDDKKTFDVIKSTRTLGIFQIESPGQRELVGKFAPRTFTDLIIDISLFRPGPVKSDMITPFLRFRHGDAPRPTLHKNLDPILDETEGVVVFHEQVIRIIAAMTGCTLAQADEKRRALGTLDGQQEIVDWFFSTSHSSGYEEATIAQVWEILRSFASFGFCKAHAAAFALPTYHSAWLKTHHTAAFIAALLTHDPGMYPRRVILDEARQWGVEIAGVDINLSDSLYRVEKREGNTGTTPRPEILVNTNSTGEEIVIPHVEQYAIRTSLRDIQGISDIEIEKIVAGRPYNDLSDFIYRTHTSLPITEALIKVGAFDSLYQTEINRRDLLLHMRDIFKLTGKPGRATGKISHLAPEQMSFNIATPTLIPSGLPELTAGEKVKNELEILGMEITHHLIEFYGDFLNSIGAVRSRDLLKHRGGSTLLVAGVKVALQTPPVRSGRRVIFLTLDDGFGCSDLAFFEDVQANTASKIYSSQLILAQGVVRRTGPRGISLRATQVWDLPTIYEKWRSVSGDKLNDSALA